MYEDLISITKLEYFDLRMDAEKLSRLESAGVNHWHNYSEAIYYAEYNAGISLDDYECIMMQMIDNLKNVENKIERQR